jgi:hypothetical protein
VSGPLLCPVVICFARGQITSLVGLSSYNLSLFCACSNNGRHCPRNTNFQTVPVGASFGQEVTPENGCVRRTNLDVGVVSPTANSDTLCTSASGTTVGGITVTGQPLVCSAGQQGLLVGFTGNVTYKACINFTTDPDTGECTCGTGSTPIANSVSCGTSPTVFSDASANCQDLFPALQ